MKIETVSAEEVRPLRTKILRPTFVDRFAAYDQDLLPETIHIAAKENGVVIGVATFFPEVSPVDGSRAFRLRGMAVDDRMQGHGVGSKILEFATNLFRTEHGAFESVWCNARVTAQQFYERAGYQIDGDEFEVEGIGPHYVMWRRL